MNRILIVCLLVCCLAGCTSRTNTQAGSRPASSALVHKAQQTSNERPLPAESNPPGDIPDTQAFVSYTSDAGRYSLEAPEGWARSARGADVRFIDKFDGESVTIAQAGTAAAIDALRRGARGGRDFTVARIALPAGQASDVSFTSNSDADAVTGKRVRLQGRAIIFEHAGKTATVLLWAPLGADNIDQWNRIANSFRWR